MFSEKNVLYWNESFYTMNLTLPSSWKSILNNEMQQPYCIDLLSVIESEYSQKICFPQKENILRAFDITPFEAVKVVILGQDPYHTP